MWFQIYLSKKIKFRNMQYLLRNKIIAFCIGTLFLLPNITQGQRYLDLNLLDHDEKKFHFGIKLGVNKSFYHFYNSNTLLVSLLDFGFNILNQFHFYFIIFFLTKYNWSYPRDCYWLVLKESFRSLSNLCISQTNILNSGRNMYVTAKNKFNNSNIKEIPNIL